MKSHLTQAEKDYLEIMREDIKKSSNNKHRVSDKLY